MIKEWIKTKAIQLMAIGWGLTAFIALYFLWAGGIHVDKRTIVTANTSSSSNSSSNSVAVNVNGSQFWGKSGYAITSRTFFNVDEMVIFINSLDEGQRFGMNIIFAEPKFIVIFRQDVEYVVENKITLFTVDGQKVKELPSNINKLIK